MITTISSIIEAYLLNENRLIIPGVGTLLKRKESGEIVFVEMLKKNDGKLTSLVANHMGVGAEEAETIVEGYADEIGRQLAAKGKFIIDGVGVLLMDAGNTISLVYNPFSHTIPEPEPAPQPQMHHAEYYSEPNSRVNFTINEFDDEEEDAHESFTTPEPIRRPTPQPSAENHAAQRKHSALYDDEAEEETSPRPKIKIQTNRKRKRLDPITIIAIIAATMAIISLVHSFLPQDVDIEIPTESAQYEMGEDFVIEEN